MHKVQASRNCKARTQVIPHAAAHIHREREVLSLCVGHTVGSLGINVAEAQAYIKVGSDPPIARYEVTPNSHDVSEIPALRPSGNQRDSPADRKIPIAPDHRWASYAANVPSEGCNDRNQGVLKGISVVGIANKNVERKGNVDRKISRVKREFQLVSVVDVSIKVRPPYVLVFLTALQPLNLLPACPPTPTGISQRMRPPVPNPRRRTPSSVDEMAYLQDRGGIRDW